MRKVEYKIICNFGHTVKGDPGDQVKSDVNSNIDSVLDDNKGVRRYEKNGSRRRYKSDNEGSIVSEYQAYISDDVNLTSESERPKIGEVNHKLWISLRNNIENLGSVDVITENTEQVTSSVSEENRTDIDLDDNIYRNNSGASPNYKTLRTIHTHKEFDKVFDEIMKQLRDMLSLNSQEYRLAQKLLQQEQREDWCCEQCGKYDDIEIHHSMVRSSIRDHFRERLSQLDGFLIDEETGEVYMESTTVIKHIAEIVHNPEVLTPLCEECHRKRHH